MNLTLNLIPFTPVETSKTFGFITEKREGYFPLTKAEFPFFSQETYDEITEKGIETLYTDFKTTEDCEYVYELDMFKSIRFAKHYFTFLIYDYFLDKADIMYPDFVKSLVVWMKFPQKANAETTQYQRFTIKVQIAKVTEQPELIISYDGISEVYNKSIEELTEFPTNLYKKVVYQNRIYKYDEMPPALKNYLHELYPLLNNPMKYYLGKISKNNNPKENNYPKYLSKITDFYENYLNNDNFRSIINIDTAGFYQLPNNKILNTKSDSNNLLFGTGTHTNPFLGIKTKGVCKPSPFPNVKFFFIYQASKENQELAYNLYNYFTYGLPSHDKTYIAFPPLNNFIKQPFNTDKGSRLEFQSTETLIADLRKYLYDRSPDKNTQYVAIYISPVAKSNTDAAKHELYYKVKELLLKENITSQVIYHESISNKSFQYYLPNIAIALLAKLNGVPWRLNRPPKNELIVGIGAFYSQTAKCRFVGSAFCFNNEGDFLNFDSFPAENTNLLAHSIRTAVLKYLVTYEKAERMVIHFYKTMSQEELQPILDILYKLNINIPVFIITINKTESKDLTAFDTLVPNFLMPISGRIIQTSYRQFLLFNNTRYYEEPKVNGGYPFPIKLSFSCSDPELLKDFKTITELIDQVYQFSRMYWKSVSQQNLPVTIKYPEMVAEMFPHFESDIIPEFGRKSLWFL